VAELAAYVDQKMRAASDAAPATDRLGLAVLVALNLADECFRARQLEMGTGGALNERALKLERLVDEALDAPESASFLS
jgi:cell division protein ZapA (FtsZ GTPase activity inhibitor)